MGHDLEGVVGNESRSAIEKKRGQQSVFQDGLMESLKKQLCGFGGSHDDGEAETGGVVENIQSDPFESPDTGAEVFSVGEHH
jgi:hypothetical protein